MPRFARIVIPGCPHHVTQRGNRGDDVFFSDDDRRTYLEWLREYAVSADLQIWAYFLMTNHIHLLVVPVHKNSLADGVGRTHLRYARWINKRQGWSGHLWSDRYYSTALDDAHLWTAVKYIECNPVRAGLVERPEFYKWSSAKAHALERFDSLLSSDRPFPARDRIGDWASWLISGSDREMEERIRRNTSTGWPSGSKEFLDQLEMEIGRAVRPGKKGRPRRSKGKGLRIDEQDGDSWS